VRGGDVFTADKFPATESCLHLSAVDPLHLAVPNQQRPVRSVVGALVLGGDVLIQIPPVITAVTAIIAREKLLAAWLGVVPLACWVGGCRWRERRDSRAGATLGEGWVVAHWGWAATLGEGWGRAWGCRRAGSAWSSLAAVWPALKAPLECSFG
jgi:hypothetical protein